MSKSPDMGNNTWMLKLRLCVCLAAVFTILFPMGCFAQSTSSPAPSDPTRVRVELPPGWETQTPTGKTIVQYAEYPDLKAAFQLVIEPKSDFADNVDLMAWAKLVKENTAKKSNLANRKETELQERKVNGRATVEYEVTGESQGQRSHYRYILLLSGNYYCILQCWTTPSHWQEAQAKFDELVSRLK